VSVAMQTVHRPGRREPLPLSAETGRRNPKGAAEPARSTAFQASEQWADRLLAAIAEALALLPRNAAAQFAEKKVLILDRP
jgi:hypothetical protein